MIPPIECDDAADAVRYARDMIGTALDELGEAPAGFAAPWHAAHAALADIYDTLTATLGTRHGH